MDSGVARKEVDPDWVAQNVLRRERIAICSGMKWPMGSIMPDCTLRLPIMTSGFVKESITAGKITLDRMTVVIGSSIEHSNRKILANTQKSNGKILK